MKIAIIGSGGREHALGVKVAKSERVEKLFFIPGNPGTKRIGENVMIDYNDHDAVLKFCVEHNIDLAIIGPEKPLTEGLSDKLRNESIKVFGPSKEAARIEGEKSFSKELMRKNNIPTAAFRTFNKKDYKETVSYLNSISYPAVIKVDGIAAGKGVSIAENFVQAKLAIEDCFLHNSFGCAGDTLVIEEFMTGQEASLFALTDGTDFFLLPAAQDHKKIFDGDKGKNTGGMGAYAPTRFVSVKDLEQITAEIVEPTLLAMRNVGSPFQGCLYCGLMMTEQGPKVVEFNCRFGDPETQVVLPLLDGDFVELLYSSAEGRLNKTAVKYNGGASVCVVTGSGGYPDKYEKGFEIKGLDEISNYVTVYHAGTKEENGKIWTNGGRVLNLTSFSKNNDLTVAKEMVYSEISKISFDGMHYRKDIADKAIKK